MIEKIFAVYDTKKDGVLEGEELTNFLNDICESQDDLKGKQEDIRAMIDGNNDGKLSKDELKAIFNP